MVILLFSRDARRTGSDAESAVESFSYHLENAVNVPPAVNEVFHVRS
ncbi:hypothetical protein H6G41_02950 [Tolypothrix sp. FACHB-123]|nr:hypothetical protein [Tolypothrix sp. FACHB-123]MBD2353590.1 hypothetical protein [Tolypothrix sp. FACHB-123]